MGSDVKLLLVGLCMIAANGVVYGAQLAHVTPAAYRQAMPSSVALLAKQQQQTPQPQAAAATTAAAPAGDNKVSAAAYRDKLGGYDGGAGGYQQQYGQQYQYPSAGGYQPQYGGKAPYQQQPYAAPNANYYPQQPYSQAPYTAPTTPYTPQPKPYTPMYGGQPTYPAQPSYPQQPYQDAYAYPQPQPQPYQPQPGTYPPKPDYGYQAQYPPSNGAYYAPSPKYAYEEKKPEYESDSYEEKGYDKYDKAPPAGICQSQTFGAYYTQAVDIDISDPSELVGVVSAFVGCKDRTTLGGECSYICYDGEHYERFIGVTTRIVASPPQDWGTVDPWYHPVYCAWALGGNVTDWKSMPAGSKKAANGAADQATGGGAVGVEQGSLPLFSCDFTIRVECCDDIVPLVPAGPEIDLNGNGTIGGNSAGGAGSVGSEGAAPAAPKKIRRRLTRNGNTVVQTATLRGSQGYQAIRHAKVSGGFMGLTTHGTTGVSAAALEPQQVVQQQQHMVVQQAQPAAAQPARQQHQPQQQQQQVAAPAVASGPASVAISTAQGPTLSRAAASFRAAQPMRVAATLQRSS